VPSLKTFGLTIPCIDLVLRGEGSGGTENPGIEAEADSCKTPDSGADGPGKSPSDTSSTGARIGEAVGAQLDKDVVASEDGAPIIGAVGRTPGASQGDPVGAPGTAVAPEDRPTPPMRSLDGA
jgi:hypothetical protein